MKKGGCCAREECFLLSSAGAEVHEFLSLKRKKKSTDALSSKTTLAAEKAPQSHFV